MFRWLHRICRARFAEYERRLGVEQTRRLRAEQNYNNLLWKLRDKARQRKDV
jgi:hypothetical protein